MKLVQTKDGRTIPWIEKMAETMMETADSFHRNNVAACEQVRKHIEPNAEEEGQGRIDQSAQDMARLLGQLMLERMKTVKPITVE